MKKILFGTAMMMAMAAIFSFSFTACGGSDDDDSSNNSGGGGYSSTSNGQSTGTFRGAKRVFGNNLVKTFGSDEGSNWEFTYDDNGFMTNAKQSDGSKNYEYKISYSENTITFSRYKDGKFKETRTAEIGANGFMSKTVDDEDIYTFTYDDAGHLTRFTINEDGKIDDDVTLTWQGGNVVNALNQDSHPKTYTVYYQTETQSPIANAIKNPDFDHIASLDIDIETFFFYAGAIGFGPDQLPLSTFGRSESSAKESTEQTETCTHTWTVDSNNRPIKMERKKVETLGEQSFTPTTKTYTWGY